MVSKSTNSGYLNRHYADAFAEFGTPLYLPMAKAWILQRTINNSSHVDASGLYPLLCCQNWSQLGNDLDALQRENNLVTISAVTDPFGDYDEDDLQRWFKDVVYPYKTHYVLELEESPETFVSSHHLRNVRKAQNNLDFALCSNPLNWLETWYSLYSVLIERHNITGISAFSKASFEKQLKVSGVTLFRAYQGDKTVGMNVWYTQNNIGYYHLGAYSEEGYSLRASFGLFWQAIQHFKSTGLRWLNLGGGAGIKSKGDDGLSRFKKGWSNTTRTAYFCGRILNPERYAALKGTIDTTYFPAYRAGEFR